MTISDFGALIKAIAAAIPKAMADFKANMPLPARPPMTGAQMAAGAQKLQALLDEAIPILAAHPGAITAADDILEALDDGGFSWAADVEDGVNAIPGGLSTIREWLPEAIWLLGAFKPIAMAIPGENPNDPNIKDR